MADQHDRWQAFVDGDIDQFEIPDDADLAYEGWRRRRPTDHLVAFFVRNAASTHGRCSRAEFCWGIATWLVATFVLVTFVAVGEQRLPIRVGWFVLSAVPVLSGAIRRLHDTGRSGVRLLLWFVPIGHWFLVAHLLASGDPGWNDHGPPSMKVTGPTGVTLHRR